MADSRRLILLRHGQTAWNAEGRAQGHADVPLDEVGLAQAAAVAPSIAAMSPSRLWSSDLSRAAQTAERVAAACGLEIRFDARLREYDVGERQGLTVAEFAERFPDEHASWTGFGAHVELPGAETSAQVRERVAAALHDVLEDLPQGETAVVVMHGAALKLGVLTLVGLPAEHHDALRGMTNCHWAELVVSPDHGPRLAAYNVGATPISHPG